MESLFALWRAYIAAQKGSSKVSGAPHGLHYRGHGLSPLCRAAITSSWKKTLCPYETWSYDIWGLIHLYQM